MNIRRTVLALLAILPVLYTGTLAQIIIPPPSRRFVHHIEAEGRVGHIFQTSTFLQGENAMGKSLRDQHSLFLKYALRFQPGSMAARAFGDAYQGIGLGFFDFGNKKEIGNPLALYVFQGARIARLAPGVSLNYEWNFGASFGWKPYATEGTDSPLPFKNTGQESEEKIAGNPYNLIIGSHINAYLNVGFYLNFILTPNINLNIGIKASHFSNGNTKYPNSGLNTASFSAGLACLLNQSEQHTTASVPLPFFQRHISYDLTLFGAFRRKAVDVEGGQIPSPDKYAVAGFCFAPMYDISHKFRAGISLDGIFDASSGVRALYGEYSYESEDFSSPPVREQLALGLSGRAELVMPGFIVGIGLGNNIFYKGDDMKSFYQILALKASLSRNLYLHVGYNLKNFRDPNYLMLGIGYRFHNQRPRL